MADARRPGSLLVFSDDWGRHPSSCQHLTRELLAQYPVWWVNTIGTRRPRFDLATLRRGTEKLRDWFAWPESAADLPDGLHVVSPKMWPWFSREHDRRLNRRLLLRSLEPAVAAMPRPVVAVSTLPIIAPLVGHLPVDRWVYYCVDDFSVWPGLDQQSLETLERQFLENCDQVVVVSDALGKRLARLGYCSTTITHGVDLTHWRNDGAAGDAPSIENFAAPRVMFWGVVDRRMDSQFLLTLADRMTSGTILLIGPRQDPDPALERHARVRYVDPLAYSDLPRVAAAASVLIMPYVDASVTRQMQPLKLKEYLATGRPTVARELPSTEPWADCLDSARDAESFSRLVIERIATGLPESQAQARGRLTTESWRAKAAQFAEVLQS